jgi:hypothetical protein
MENVILHIADGTEQDEDAEGNMEWMAFMCHLAHSHIDTIQDELSKFKYIIGLEKTDYEHYHFYVKMTEKDYYNFAMRVFRKKYKLRGRATKGAPRQYGKEKNIKSHEKIARYTCKDKNVRSNMTKQEIDEVLGMKLEDVKNTKNKCKYHEMLEYVETQLLTGNGYSEPFEKGQELETRLVKIEIINYMKTQKMILRRTTIDSYYYYFRCYSTSMY